MYVLAHSASFDMHIERKKSRAKKSMILKEMRMELSYVKYFEKLTLMSHPAELSTQLFPPIPGTPTPSPEIPS